MVPFFLGQPLSSLKLGAYQATIAVNMGDKTDLADSNNLKKQFARITFGKLANCIFCSE